MSERWRVKLPAGVRPPFEVYLNGVPQREGADFEYRNGRLLFDRPLAKEGKLGFWRWFMGAWGVGTYRQNDSVDVAYQSGGRPQVAHGLEIEPPHERRAHGLEIEPPRARRARGDD